ncbi:hypothetical protein MMC30_006593 [Trapelia coarctata]|nr:hypothetical protein [Trapelia coarctata]
MVDDWIAHTPTDILAKNFGVYASVFDKTPKTNPYILPTNVSNVRLSTKNPDRFLVEAEQFKSWTQGISQSQRHSLRGLRELHWHPNVSPPPHTSPFCTQIPLLTSLERPKNGSSSTAAMRATVFNGGVLARTFDFSASDTAVFPDNPGHYVGNTSYNETLVWIELYKSDRAADISLTQWLALTPADIVAAALNMTREVVERLKKEKQLIVKGV